jgi:predicted GIY-YIG superfamily endonuclease
LYLYATIDEKNLAMSKEKTVKKEEKKKPAKTLKEKREAKKAKKSGA